MKQTNPPHPNPDMLRVYPTKENIAELRRLDTLQDRAIYRRLPQFRFVGDWGMGVLRWLYRVSGKKLELYWWGMRLDFIRWFYGPQDTDYLRVFPGYYTGFYDIINPRPKKKPIKN